MWTPVMEQEEMFEQYRAFPGVDNEGVLDYIDSEVSVSSLVEERKPEWLG